MTCKITRLLCTLQRIRNSSLLRLPTLGRISLLAPLLVMAAACSPQEPTVTLGVYSGRHYNTDKQLYKQFTDQTGIGINLLEAKDKVLLQRLVAEGSNSPADVLVLADAARPGEGFWHGALSNHQLQPAQSRCAKQSARPPRPLVCPDAPSSRANRQQNRRSGHHHELRRPRQSSPQRQALPAQPQEHFQPIIGG